MADESTPAEVPDLDGWILANVAPAVAYAASLLKDRGAAEDVVQDCFFRLLEKAHLYDLPRDGRKLLFRSVTNACFNRNTREKPVLSLQAAQDDRPQDIRDPQTEPPERILMTRELEAAVAEGLAKLPLLQRAALELKILGHSLQEIGQMLEVTSGHAGVLIHRARQVMAEYLAPYLEEKVG